jgi:hypothetical protein
MKKKYLLIFVILSAYALQATPIIYLQFRPYTQNPQNKRQQRRAKNEEKKTIGVVATYAGNVETSDLESDISFPRKQVSNNVQIIVSPKITPIIRQNKLISHWQIDDNKHTKIYEFKLITDNNKKTNWQVTEIPIPDNKKIPIESIVIIASAENVVIPTGIFSTTLSKNINIPSIFIKRNFKTIENALFVTNLNFLLGEITPINSQTGKTFDRQIVASE